MYRRVNITYIFYKHTNQKFHKCFERVSSALNQCKRSCAPLLQNVHISPSLRSRSEEEVKEISRQIQEKKKKKKKFSFTLFKLQY